MPAPSQRRIRSRLRPNASRESFRSSCPAQIAWDLSSWFNLCKGYTLKAHALLAKGRPATSLQGHRSYAGAVFLTQAKHKRRRSQMRSSAQLERRRFERAPISAQVEFELTNSSS